MYGINIIMYEHCSMFIHNIYIPIGSMLFYLKFKNISPLYILTGYVRLIWLNYITQSMLIYYYYLLYPILNITSLSMRNIHVHQMKIILFITYYIVMCLKIIVFVNRLINNYNYDFIGLERACITPLGDQFFCF